MLVGDLLAELDARFPFADAGDWDPVGLQIGGVDRISGRIGVCHEVTADVLATVRDLGLDCLVAYHPLMFVPSTSLVDGPSAEGLALGLAEAGASLIVVHTALDVARPGTADALLAALGVRLESTFGPVDDVGGGDIGRIGRFDQPMNFEDLAVLVTAATGAPVRTTAQRPDRVETVGTVPGSGGSFVASAAGLVDVYISGDISHHDANQATAMGLGIIDAGHVPTERPGVRALYAAVCESSPDAMLVDEDPHPWEG
jgi:dinuclear metal center YbgI/SA1388 family protein